MTPLILVAPDRLLALSAQTQKMAADLQRIDGELGTALTHLSWESRQKVQIESSVAQARGQVRTLSSQVEQLTRFLQQKAQTLEEADREGSSVPGIFVSLSNWIKSALPFQFTSLPWPFSLSWSNASTTPWLPAGALPAIGIATILPVLSWIKLPVSAPDNTSGMSAPENVSVTRTSNSPSTFKTNIVPIIGESCAIYAQRRRPDLGRAGGGAANYLDIYRNSKYQVSEKDIDLRDRVKPNSVLVWPANTAGAHKDYGHIAVIDEVGKDYVKISDANWPEGETRTGEKMSLDDLQKLWIIP